MHQRPSNDGTSNDGTSNDGTNGGQVWVDPTMRPKDGRTAPTAAARRSEWASDRALDPGDSHVKGEASLCVGEAA